jgi:hypothetical protein
MIEGSIKVRRIASRLQDPFHRAVFEAAIQSFEQEKNPLRVNNFATGLRELSRIVLHDLAPDEKLQACSWYKPKMDSNGKIVIERGQRVKYAVQAGLNDDFVANDLDIDVDKTVKRFVKLINRLSAFTHVTPSTFNADESSANAIAREALGTFAALFRTITTCRTRIIRAVESHANRALIEALIEETVDELDQIATHYYVKSSGIEMLRVESMDHEFITFAVSGFVDCVLQYGSDGDVRRGDGVRTSASYPLTCRLQASTESPDELVIEAGSLEVDNSSFYE